MLSHLRLARERGSLIAPNSPVQDRATLFLIALDQQDKAKERFEAVKRMVASGAQIESIWTQYPEYFPAKDPFAKAKTEDGDYDIDKVNDADVEWEAAGDEDEDEELSAWIENRTSGTISGADL